MSRSLRTRRLLSALVAFAFVFGPAAAWLGGVRAEPFENRPLAPAPTTADGWHALDTLAPWASDHLPLREQAVRSKAWTDFHALGTIPGTVPTALRPPIQTTDGPHPVAPTVVRGRDGYLFLGQDFDNLCLGTARFRSSLRRLSRLVDVIAASGRRVVLTVAPNKSTVMSSRLPAVLPHGRCATSALRHQAAVLDDYADPHYLALRPSLDDLLRGGVEPYWRDDTHWTGTGASTYAGLLAARLGIAGLRTHDLTVTHEGDLGGLIGVRLRETRRVKRVTGDISEIHVPHDGYQLHVAPMRRWTSETPGALPGRTVLIGDSFTANYLDNLQPLFAHGTFLYDRPYQDMKRVVSEIQRADTVVIEVVQRFVPTTRLLGPEFLADVRTALRPSSGSPTAG